MLFIDNKVSVFCRRVWWWGKQQNQDKSNNSNIIIIIQNKPQHKAATHPLASPFVA